MNAARRVGTWLSHHFWGMARLRASGARVYRTGGKRRLLEDVVVTGSKSEFLVEDDILRPLIDERRRERELGRHDD